MTRFQFHLKIFVLSSPLICKLRPILPAWMCRTHWYATCEKVFPGNKALEVISYHQRPWWIQSLWPAARACVYLWRYRASKSILHALAITLTSTGSWKSPDINSHQSLSISLGKYTAFLSDYFHAQFYYPSPRLYLLYETTTLYALHLHDNFRKSILFFSFVLSMRKLNHREIKYLAQSHFQHMIMLGFKPRQAASRGWVLTTVLHYIL